MANRHADQGYRKLGQVLKNMTWQERWDHLIYYYGVAAVIAVAVLLMGIGVAVDVLTPEPTVLFEGITVNVRWTDEIEQMMTADLFEHLGGTDKKMEKVYANHYSLEEYSAAMIESMTAQVYTGEIDYIIVNKFAMDSLAPWSVFTDLNLVLSEETMKQWEDSFVYAEDVYSLNVYPIAIDISKTAFAKQCTYAGDHLYIGFPGNTGREMTPEDFLAYLLSCFDGE